MSNCRLCNSNGPHVTYQAQELMFGWKNWFEYFKCGSCGCLQISEIPSDLERYYPDNYYSLAQDRPSRPSMVRRMLTKARVQYRLHGGGGLLESVAWRFGPLSVEIQEILPYLKLMDDIQWGTRFLDVGCGEHSKWLSALYGGGFAHLTGLDPYMSASATRQGVKYVCAQLRDIQGQFDVITFNHSLEHMPDQLDALSQVHRLLSDNGCCLVRIPLSDSYVWDKYGTNWVELDAPRHLYLHTASSLEIIARRAGFHVDKVHYDSTAFEFAGSEQYLAGIPLVSENSFWNGLSASIFSSGQWAYFQQEAKRVNREKCGGRAAFFLRKIL